MSTVKLADAGFADRDPSFANTLDADLRSRFQELYDSETFIYDILFSKSANTGYIITPPLASDQVLCLEVSFRRVGIPITQWVHGTHHTRGMFTTSSNQSSISITLGDIDYNISQNKVIDYLKEKAPSRVSYTLQKDNSLGHVKDWIAHQININKADAVIIYDNESTLEYTSERLTDVVTQLFPDKVYVVKVSPKYGPSGEEFGFSHKYLQHACFDHIRSAIGLSLDSGDIVYLLNSDIDELTYSKGGRCVFDIIENTDFCALHFKGYWVFPNALPHHNSLVTHDGHTMIDISREACPSKWVFKICDETMTSQLTPHYVLGKENLFSDKIVYLHHKFVSTNWKYNRKWAIGFSESDEGSYHRLQSRRHEDIMHWVQPQQKI